MNISLNTPMSDYDRGVQAGKAAGRTEAQARIEELEAALIGCVEFMDRVEGDGYGGMTAFDAPHGIAKAALEVKGKES